MAESLFTQLQADAFRAGVSPRTEEAKKWFREKAKKLTNVKKRDILKDDRTTRVSRPLPGYMYHFFYDPKHKETLPYYDQFPLVILVDKAPNGFYGLNLHYLHPLVRAKFLDKLLETANNKRFDENTRLRLNYQLLSSVKKYKEFAPCFKHYLRKHVESNIVQIHAPEWDIAVFLPTEDFAKSTKYKVWNESKGKYK